MIVVSGTIFIQPKKVAAAIEAAKVMMEKTAEEVGCISYRFYADIEAPDVFRVFEEWENDEALQAHFETPHMAEFRSKLGGFLAAPPAIRRYVVSEFGEL